MRLSEGVNMDILEQIKAGYGSFSRPRQRISDFILNNPEQCCFLSLKNFAETSGHHGGDGAQLLPGAGAEQLHGTEKSPFRTT